MPKIFALRHQLAEQQAKLKAQAKGSSGDSPTSCASDEEKLDQGPSSSAAENTCVSDNKVSGPVCTYTVQSEHFKGVGIQECEKSAVENTGDSRNKDEQNAPLELIGNVKYNAKFRQRSTGKVYKC